MEPDIIKSEFSLPQCTFIDIQLTFGNSLLTETELVKNITDPHLTFNCAGEMLLAPLISHLKMLGYPIDSAMVWYYSPTANVKVYCGNDPLPFTIAIPLFEIKENRLIIVCQEPIRNKFGTVISLGSNPSQKSRPEEETASNDKSSRRTKERKIGYIIEKVSKWRKLYNGSTGAAPTDDQSKMTLEEAANKVAISKKSLDDYLLQLRFGRKFGFNFQEHKDDKVGVLRAYVKKFKGLHPYVKKIENGEEVPPDVIQKLQEPGTPACKHNRCCAPSYALPFKNKESQQNKTPMYPNYQNF